DDPRLAGQPPRPRSRRATARQVIDRAGRGAVMTEPTAELPSCCGERVPGVKGKAQTISCILCPRSGRYYADEPGYQERQAGVQQRFDETGSWLPDVPEPIRRRDGRVVS